MSEEIDAVLSKLLNLRNKGSLIRCGIKEDDIYLICRLVRPILKKQPVLLELRPPITLVGDIHGQFQDLLRIFENAGYPPKTNYLFLGDYVDRGADGLEVIVLLLAFKVKYSDSFFLIRGNHESRPMNKTYGFYTECTQKYNASVFNAIEDIFDLLPFAALINEKIFCCHGGLSPLLNSMSQINEIERPTEIPADGLICDLVWSDPCTTAEKWSNSARQIGFGFGRKVLRDFINKFCLDLVVRAHEVVSEGYEFPFKGEDCLITLFSAPNYCGTFGNRGAILQVNTNLVCNFTVFNPVNWSKREYIQPPKEEETSNLNREEKE